MQKPPVNRFGAPLQLFSLLLAASLLLVACSEEQPTGRSAAAPVGSVDEPDDLIARVGDELITFGQLNSMLNSSAMVGMSIPELGTPERNQALITLLDKAISANLVYLDAKKKGIDRLSSYKEDVNRFEDTLLAAMYKNMLLEGDVQVSETEVLHHYNTQSRREMELTDETRSMIEAVIRKKKLDLFETTLRDRIRENVEVVINEKVLSSAYDSKRSDADVVATFDNHRVTWSQVREQMQNANRNPAQTGIYISDDRERKSRLEQHLDNVIMALKGRTAGLEEDPVYVKRTGDYRKARLINEHRNGMIHQWNPSDDELMTYSVNNMDSIAVPEMRKIQMVVVATKEEAESIKAQLDKGEITMFQAAQQYSIDPNAKSTLGEMGWVSQGTGFQGLDEFTFNLEPEVVSEPVESPAGWHLVKVLDVTDAQFDNLEDPQTRQRAFRAYMQDKFDNYVVDLRQNHFDVSVYDAELTRQLQNEADFIADLTKKARQEGSMTEQRIEDMQKWITAPPQQ